MTHTEISIGFDRKFKFVKRILKDIYLSDSCDIQIDLTFIATVRRAPLLHN